MPLCDMEKEVLKTLLSCPNCAINVLVVSFNSVKLQAGNTIVLPENLYALHNISELVRN